jgi:hypothetical protein
MDNDTAALFNTLGRLNDVLIGFEAGRNGSGGWVSNIAASLIYAARDTLTAQAAEIARLTGERDDALKSVDDNWITHQQVIAERQRAETAEAALAAALARVAVLEGVLKAWEEWEAEWIMDDDCWANDIPRLNQQLFDRMIELQAKRAAALKGGA